MINKKDRKKIGLYIHIPFCERKCNYCDFYSMVKSEGLEENYVNALINEICAYSNLLADRVVDTLFIGGGTPSYLEVSNLEKIMKTIYENYAVSDNCEITMEANPNSFTVDKAKKYKNIGVNRLSLGVQSLDDDILKIIGRLHDRKGAIGGIDNAIKVGFDNINVDLMFNIPKQTEKQIEETVETILATGIQHISFYSLILEKNTKLWDDVQKKNVKLNDDECDRAHYYLGRKLMEKEGFRQYEISNFCKTGYECKHNMRYWHGDEYIGFGPFSHSFLDGERFNNEANIIKFNEFYNTPKHFNSLADNEFKKIDEDLTDEDKLFEYIMLRLRLVEGFSIEDINEKFDINFEDVFEKEIFDFKKEELLIVEENRVKLSIKGLDLSNRVMVGFMEKVYDEV